MQPLAFPATRACWWLMLNLSPPRPSCCKATGQPPATTVVWGYSSPGAGLCISFCWRGQDFWQPISPAWALLLQQHIPPLPRQQHLGRTVCSWQLDGRRAAGSWGHAPESDLPSSPREMSTGRTGSGWVPLGFGLSSPRSRSPADGSGLAGQGVSQRLQKASKTRPGALEFFALLRMSSWTPFGFSFSFVNNMELWDPNKKHKDILAML